jgi:hypothetical protein
MVEWIVTVATNAAWAAAFMAAMMVIAAALVMIEDAGARLQAMRRKTKERSDAEVPTAAGAE